ncbi:MAG: alpha-amylase family glycosyl hydrolase [Verrucomicrobiales bacterium]
MASVLGRSEAANLQRRFETLYGSDESKRLMRRFEMLVGRYGVGEPETVAGPPWDENEAVLITYADTISDGEGTPLQAVRRFLTERLKGVIRTVHLLPFYPWSSDDGFSVIDYRAVKSSYGDWADVEAVGHEFSLMFDLVLNHCSSESAWFRDFCIGADPARNYFIVEDPGADLSQVVRPRPTDLLTKTQTRDGEKWVWTTFSADQVDLNWRDPNLLFEFLDILFLYISKGMRIVRLDAIAFLWKEPGTDCLHRPETHEVVKLIRDVLRIVAPHVIVLTETNVPHEENISYFGDGDEAHMVYNFSLPPLLLHALVTGDGTHLSGWAKSLPDLPEGQAFLNFTASHDGIGVRPLQGIVPDDDLAALIAHVRERGGMVSMRSMPDGSERPYELNITYRDALGVPGDEDLGVARFLCSQAVMLAMRGVPALYIHSLLGTRNWHDGFAETGRNRTLNRRRWEAPELAALLGDPATSHAQIFGELTRWLMRRQNHPAFHPDAPMRVLDFDAGIFAFLRTAKDASERIACLANLTAKPRTLSLSDLTDAPTARELLCAREIATDQVELAPYQAAWVQL